MTVARISEELGEVHPASRGVTESPPPFQDPPSRVTQPDRATPHRDLELRQCERAIGTERNRGVIAGLLLEVE